MRKESRYDTQSCQRPMLFLYETRVTAYRQDSESQKIKVRGGVENLLLLLTSRLGKSTFDVCRRQHERIDHK